MSRLNYFGPVVVVLAVAFLTTAAARTTTKSIPGLSLLPAAGSLSSSIELVDDELQRLWDMAGVSPAAPADDLLVLRRLSLALHGTIPSLEEIRLFEADSRPDRVQQWTAAMLKDERFHQYFAERLARAFVGVEQGTLLIYRRDRFTDWLARQLKQHTPYDQIVRKMVQNEGVWTGKGEVNFITSCYADDNFDLNQLTSRTARAFLGQRIDCAQCHDHPFDHWKQSEYEGLAANFGQVTLTPLGGIIEDNQKEFTIQDRKTLESRVVLPAYPFHSEWAGTGGTRRQQLARWLTHPDNQRFPRATANRVWGLLFGRPFATPRRVDDLPDPKVDSQLALLDILGEDFRAHQYDLGRLIQVIAGSQAFRQQSIESLDEREGSPTPNADQLQIVRSNWAVFPLNRLRPEQVIGAMLQANNIRTIDQNSHLFMRALRFFREQDFLNEYGDPGADELQDFSATVTQALLRMNGKLTHELSEPNPLMSPGRISFAGESPSQRVETVFLVCLTRRPAPAECETFEAWFPQGQADGTAVHDLFWTLFNSQEFAWNH